MRAIVVRSHDEGWRYSDTAMRLLMAGLDDVCQLSAILPFYSTPRRGSSCWQVKEMSKPALHAEHITLSYWNGGRLIPVTHPTTTRKRKKSMRPTLSPLSIAMLLSFLLTALATPMPLAMATNPSYNSNNVRLQMGHRSSPDLPRAAPELEPRKASRSRENVLNNMMRVRGAGKLAMRERVAEQQRQIRERLAVSRPTCSCTCSGRD